MIEVRIVSFWGDIYWEESMSRDVLYLELDGGYIGKRRWKNSSTPHLISVHFTVCILYLTTFKKCIIGTMGKEMEIYNQIGICRVLVTLVLV